MRLRAEMTNHLGPSSDVVVALRRWAERAIEPVAATELDWHAHSMHLKQGTIGYSLWVLPMVIGSGRQCCAVRGRRAPRGQVDSFEEPRHCTHILPLVSSKRNMSRSMLMEMFRFFDRRWCQKFCVTL